MKMEDLRLEDFDNGRAVGIADTLKKVREVIEKHFVHAFTGDGTVHSSNCRMCKVLKELQIIKEV